jgi:hypothetical protein
MEKTISEIKENEARKVFAVEVREAYTPHYEVDLPTNVIERLGLMENDTLQFVEENGKIFIEKV